MLQSRVFAAFAFTALSIPVPVVAQPHREAFQSVTPATFDSGGAISRQFHLNAESYQHTATIARTTPERRLPVALRAEVADFEVAHTGGTSAFGDYVAGNRFVDGVIILHRGEVVFEDYPRMEPWQRHYAWSVTKVLTSTTLAVLVERGLVDMQEPVDRYVPALADSAWAGIPLQHIADMASGIDCLDSDGYQDRETCVYRMEEALDITAQTDRELTFLAELQAMQLYREAGRTNEYVSANTNVLMLVIEAVTGESYARAVQDLIWSRIGPEADALMSVSREGYAYASGGWIARLRDVARFGQVYAQPELTGVLAPKTLALIRPSGVELSEDTRIRDDEGLGDDLPTGASWQWDRVWADGARFKSGYSGQGLYVDQGRGLVAAWFGTGDDYNEVRHQLLSVTRQMVRAGLFD